MNVAFDDALKVLAADPKNAERSSRWFLREAHKVVQADLADLERAGDAGGHRDSDDNTGGAAEFAAIDELEGEKYEAALARMSLAKQERFLRQRG